MIRCVVCLISVTAVFAQMPKDQLAYYQNATAHKFAVNHLPSAKMLVEQGLRSFPEDAKLTALKKLIDEQLEQQRQQRQQKNGQSPENPNDQSKQDGQQQQPEDQKDSQKKDQQAAERQQKGDQKQPKNDAKKPTPKGMKGMKLSKEHAEKILQSLRERELDYKKNKQKKRVQRGQRGKDW